MANIYLTRHGRTFINELWRYLGSDEKKLLDSKYHRRLDRTALNDLVQDEGERAEFLSKVGLANANDFLVGENLTEKGQMQAVQLGIYLSSRNDVSGVVVPTKARLPIYRNNQTAKEIQAYLGRRLSSYPVDALTDTLGRYIPSDSSEIPEIVSQIAPLAGHVLVLNSGILEGIVNHCGGDLEFFDNCGLVVLRPESGRLVIEQNYLSNEEL